MRLLEKTYSRLLGRIAIATLSLAPVGSVLASAADDPLAAAMEAVRKTHDEAQLESLKTQLEQRIAGNANNALTYYDLARVESYLMDVYEMRKNHKAAGAAVDKAIESSQKSLALDPSEDQNWVWLAKAIHKQGDKAKSREAIQRALQLNPASPLAKAAAAELQQ